MLQRLPLVHFRIMYEIGSKPTLQAYGDVSEISFDPNRTNVVRFLLKTPEARLLICMGANNTYII